MGQHMLITPIAGALGAEILGADLSAPLGDDDLAELRAAILRHLVVVVRDQRIALTDLEALTERLGGFGETPFLRTLADHPNVVRVVKEADEVRTLNFGGAWHSDYSFQAAPPSFTLLHAWEVPPYGGDTLWSNQHLAYERLSAGLRSTLDGLSAVHSAGRAYASDGILARTAAKRTMQIDTGDEALAEVAHPLVVTHPETGRRGLFLNPTYTVRIAGWTAEESRPLLEQLQRHSIRDTNVCRIRWNRHDLAIWDNRCTQHNALNDYDGFRREMYRTTVVGTVPV